MKIKKLLFNIFASIGVVFLILPMCLGMYAANGTVGSFNASQNYNIFSDFGNFNDVYKVANDSFNAVWATITDVLAVILLVLAAIYVVLFILQLLKVGGKKINYSKYLMPLAVIILVLGIVALITGIIFIASNSLVIADKTVISFSAGTGFITLIVGSLLTGISGIIANNKRK